MFKFIYRDYGVGQLYGIQIGKYKVTSYSTKSQEKNKSRCLHLSYCRQRSENIWEVVYTKELNL